VAPIKVYSGEEAALFSTRDAFPYRVSQQASRRPHHLLV
jgi:hypothetical protein